MLDAEDDLSFTHALQALAENIPLLYNDDAVNSLADALFYAQMTAWNAGTNAALAEANHTTATIRSARKCKAKNPARCRYHANEFLNPFKRGKAFLIKTQRGEMDVCFDKKLYDHFMAKDKDRLERAGDLPHAIDAVYLGHKIFFRKDNENRVKFLYPFKENNKHYIMKVIAIKRKKRWQVLTYHRLKDKPGLATRPAGTA